MASYNNTPFSGGSSFGAPAPSFSFQNQFQMPELFRPDNPLYNPVRQTPVAESKYAPNYFTDYNDPYTINSVADLFLNQEGRARRYGEWARSPLLGTSVVPLIGSIDLLWNQAIKPIVANTSYGWKDSGVLGAVQGLGRGVQQSGLNALVNLGETLDVIQNPVKATLIEGADALGLGNYGSKYDGDVLRGLKNTLGIGTEGRVNYDYDTGNFFTDLALEIITDPMNWITFGGKAAMSTGAQQAIESAVQAAAGEGSEQLTKKLGKQLARAYANSSDDLISTTARMFRTNSPAVIRSTEKVFANPYLNKLVDGTLTRKQSIDLAERVLRNMQENVLRGAGALPGETLMKAARKTVNAVDKTEKALLKSALYTSGLGEAWHIGKKVANTAIQPVLKKINEYPEKLATKLVKEADVIASNTSELIPLADKFADLPLNMKGLRDRYIYSTAVGEALDNAAIREFAEGLGKQYRHAQLPMDPVSKFIYLKVSPLYKTGFLSSLGFPMRNVFDGVTRNAVGMGGLEHLAEASLDFVKAVKDVENYENILRRILDYGQEGYPVKEVVNRQYKTVIKYSDVASPDLISAFYKAHNVPEMPIDLFKSYNRLINDPSSVLGGRTAEVMNIVSGGNPTPKVLQLFENQLTDPSNFNEFMRQVQKLTAEHPDQEKAVVTGLYNKFFAKTTRTQNAIPKRLISDAIEFQKLPVDPFSHPQFEAFLRAKYKGAPDFGFLSSLIDKNPILQANELVERGLRWAMYQQQVGMGATHGEAIQKIIKTHFVYDNKPLSLKLVETYFPFTGFTLKNYEYWVDAVSDKSPFAFANGVKKLSTSQFGELVKDATKLPVYEYRNKNVYNIAAYELGRKYLGDVPKTTSKQFAAHIRHFVKSHPFISAENLSDLHKTYVKSLAKPSGAGAMFNNIGNIMAPIMQLQSLTNPDLIDYENRERPEVFSMEPEHPYVNPAGGVLFHILNGNIRYGKQYLDQSDPKQRKVLQMVFKFNPAWMDAFQFGINPVEAVGERLLPFLENMALWARGSDGYRTNLDYLLGSIPVLGVSLQRYTPLKNRWESTKNPLVFLPTIYGAVADYPQFNPRNPMENPSENLVRLWYGQYKGNDLLHNPYDTYPQYSYSYGREPDERSEAEKILARQYAAYRSMGLSEEYDPYVRYPNLARAAHLAQLDRYGAFDPNNINPNATKDMIGFWYRDYKQNKLPKEYNPYQYYPEYQLYPTTKSSRSYSSKEPLTAEKQLARYYAYFKSNKLPEQYNPYTYFKELSQAAHQEQLQRYGRFDPNAPDPNATRKAVNFWYRDYKQNSLPEEYNPYRYYASAIPKSVNTSTDYQALRKVYSDYYSGASSAQRPGTTYYRQAQRINRIARPKNFYKSLYTSTGKSRMQLRMGKLNSKSLPFRLSEMKYLFRRYWSYVK